MRPRFTAQQRSFVTTLELVAEPAYSVCLLSDHVYGAFYGVIFRNRAAIVCVPAFWTFTRVSPSFEVALFSGSLHAGLSAFMRVRSGVLRLDLAASAVQASERHSAAVGLLGSPRRCPGERLRPLTFRTGARLVPKDARPFESVPHT